MEGGGGGAKGTRGGAKERPRCSRDTRRGGDERHVGLEGHVEGATEPWGVLDLPEAVCVRVCVSLERDACVAGARGGRD